jgi:hypothetical protein
VGRCHLRKQTTPTAAIARRIPTLRGLCVTEDDDQTIDATTTWASVDLEIFRVN